MKASELIAKLKDLAVVHGDLEVRINNDEWQCSEELRSVTHETAKPARGVKHSRSPIPSAPECYVVN